jgi:hypothetical protein
LFGAVGLHSFADTGGGDNRPIARCIHGLFEYLKEGFVFFNHAQVVAGAFFDGFLAVAQIQNFRVQRIIALFFFADFLG